MPPDRMTGFNPWPWDPHHGLSVRCVLWKGVDNLLNHTLSPAGTSGGTDKRKLLNKTRSTTDSGDPSLQWPEGIFAKKSDVETSHDIPKFWWNF